MILSKNIKNTCKSFNQKFYKAFKPGSPRIFKL
jgi:hypothetical protein